MLSNNTPAKSLLTVLSSISLCAVTAIADVRIATDFRAAESARFSSANVPAPVKNDATSTARVRIIGGLVDPNSGSISKLRDGTLPTEPDQPDENFFFDASTPGGRVLLDLERLVEVQQVNTYSRHPDTRGPQVYKLYASAG